MFSGKKVRIYLYGLGVLEKEEESFLHLLPVSELVVLESYPQSLAFPTGEGEYVLALILDERKILASQKRFSPINYSGGNDIFDGRRMVVLFSHPNFRGGLVSQSVVWMLKTLSGVETLDGKVGYHHLESHKVTPFPWGMKKAPSSGKIKARGSGWQPKMSTTASTVEEDAPLSMDQLEKEIEFVSLLGAFNREVGRSMSTTTLHRFYRQLVKRLALVAESAKSGGGALLYKLVASLTAQELSGDREKVLPRFESLFLYGILYENLDGNQRALANEFQLADEQSHFSRIMDVDALRDQIKLVVGTASAGDPLIARMIMNAARLREDKGIKAYFELPHDPIVEVGNYRNPLAPFQVRSHYPYLACVLSASSKELARDLMEIFRKLIVQYPLESTFFMLEEWLMRMGVDDPSISFSAAQVVRNEDDSYRVKIVGVGGGTVLIQRVSGKTIRQFSVVGDHYGQGRIAVGRSDFQQPHYSFEEQITAGDRIFLFPVTDPEPNLVNPNPAAEVSIQVSSSKHRTLTTFKWTDEYVNDQLREMIERVMELAPSRVDIQFAHVHGDRDPGEDQVVGSKIAGAIGRALSRKGVNVETRPLSDNYHVVDRLDFRSWIALMEKHSGLSISEVQFEDALISRHLGDELIARLYKTHPDDIVAQGGNIYFRPPEIGNMMIELYDGVSTSDARGRMGCVPFQVGFELYRMNPEWVNAAYRTYIFDNFPNSLVASWWRRSPDASYQRLMLENVYLLPCAERMALKARVDAEVDRSYQAKCVSGLTPLLDGLLEATDFEKVVLLHVLEGFYDAQEKKSSALWQAGGFPKVFQWRVSFQRHTGMIKALDWNRHLK